MFAFTWSACFELVVVVLTDYCMNKDEDTVITAAIIALSEKRRQVKKTRSRGGEDPTEQDDLSPRAPYPSIFLQSTPYLHKIVKRNNANITNTQYCTHQTDVNHPCKMSKKFVEIGLCVS